MGSKLLHALSAFDREETKGFDVFSTQELKQQAASSFSSMTLHSMNQAEIIFIICPVTQQYALISHSIAAC